MRVGESESQIHTDDRITGNAPRPKQTTKLDIGHMPKCLAGDYESKDWIMLGLVWRKTQGHHFRLGKCTVGGEESKCTVNGEPGLM